MASDERTPPARKRFLAHGYVGIVVIVAAEFLLFSGNAMVGRWFTPIVWTGYLLLIDALVYRVRGGSLLVSDRAEFALLVLISILCWWLFEWYNAPRFWRSGEEMWWHYHNLEPNPFLRRLGYDWAFATISPALFETAEFLAATLFRGAIGRRAIRISRPALYVMIGAGAGAALLPLVWPNLWLVPLVWLAYLFLFDPINALGNRPSIAGDLARGDHRRLWALLASGGLCGGLWEFWNYWAISKWTYTVPYLGDIKLFEMPVLGFGGFPPFAIECWVMYVFLRGRVLGAEGWRAGEIAFRPSGKAPSSGLTSRPSPAPQSEYAR